MLAQETLPEAADGDIRLILMNGDVLTVGGTPALIRRRPSKGETRSNISQGAAADSMALNDDIRRIAEAVRPRVIADGLFLVGVDIAGSRMLEINVFSPGGLGFMPAALGVDFAPAIVEAIERKVLPRRSNPLWSNAFINTL